MKKLDLGQTLQILGNVGVIVGILLLVYELNQNREMTAAQTRNEISQGLVEMLFEMQSPENASIVVRGNRGEELVQDENEGMRYGFMTFAQLRYHENVHFQYRIGLYDEAEFLAHRARWKSNLLQNEGVVRVFCISRDGLSPEFVAEIEGLLTTYKCE